MKRLIISLVATLTTSIAFCQEPTTVQKENLKGNVFSVRTSSYEYSENFGNSKEGKLQETEVIFFDNIGRAALYNTNNVYDYNNVKFGTNNGYSYSLVKYNKDGDNLEAELTLLRGKKGIGELPKLNDIIDDLLIYLNNSREKREILYNNNIVVRHDALERDYPTSNYKLIYRKIAKQSNNNTYECRLYDKTGEPRLDYKEIYNSKGQLIEVDNERQFSGVTFNSTVKTPLAGKYLYNEKGLLISYTQQKKYLPERTEYVYNDHGDIAQIIILHPQNADRPDEGEWNKNREIVYDNYKYDDNGNWVYRIKTDVINKKYIEKRQIDYCNSSAEIEEKVKDLYSKLPVLDIKAANEFSDYYSKYLYRKTYEAEIPLIDYDSKYASVKNADKATVIMRVSFSSPNCDGSCSLSLNAPDKYMSKLKDISKEIDTKGREESKYSYKNGTIYMNNDEYIIDATGTLKNVTRNIVFNEKIRSNRR